MFLLHSLQIHCVVICVGFGEFNDDDDDDDDANDYERLTSPPGVFRQTFPRLFRRPRTFYPWPATSGRCNT